MDHVFGTENTFLRRALRGSDTVTADLHERKG